MQVVDILTYERFHEPMVDFIKQNFDRITW